MYTDFRIISKEQAEGFRNRGAVFLDPRDSEDSRRSPYENTINIPVSEMSQDQSFTKFDELGKVDVFVAVCDDKVSCFLASTTKTRLERAGKNTPGIYPLSDRDIAVREVKSMPIEIFKAKLEKDEDIKVFDISSEGIYKYGHLETAVYWRPSWSEEEEMKKISASIEDKEDVVFYGLDSRFSYNIAGRFSKYRQRNFLS